MLRFSHVVVLGLVAVLCGLSTDADAAPKRRPKKPKNRVARVVPAAHAHIEIQNGDPPGWVVDFPGAKPGVSYPPALANVIAGRDVNGSEPEGRIQVVTVYDEQPGCRGFRFCYGFDHPEHPKVGKDGGMDFIETIEHEIGHALGFSTQARGGTLSPFMTNRAAAAAATRFPSELTNGHLRLGAGTDTTSHFVESHAGLLMAGRGRSPFLDFMLCVMKDIGYRLTPSARCPDLPP
jgi:hypothetical protein